MYSKFFVWVTREVRFFYYKVYVGHFTYENKWGTCLIFEQMAEFLHNSCMAHRKLCLSNEALSPRTRQFKNQPVQMDIRLNYLGPYLLIDTYTYISC